MSKNLVLAVLGVALVSALAWILILMGGEESREGPVARAGPEGDAVAVGELGRPEGSADVGEEFARRVSPRQDADAPARDAFEKALCGMSGRLLEHDGRPVVGIEVTLIEWLRRHIRPSLPRILDRTAPEPELEVARAITDEAGCFALEGARPRGMHFLGIDLGGPRGDLRLVEVARRSGETSELGDIVLAPTVEVLGEVVDDAGDPVVGARVRLAQVHPVWLAVGAGLRGESFVLADAAGRDSMIALPEWIRRLLARFPVPTTATDVRGRFRLPAAPEGSASLLVDRPGFEPLIVPEAQHAGGTRRVVGKLVLSRGQPLTGRAVDSRGEPVCGAEVFGGADPASRELLAILQPGGRTDEEGRFELHGVPSAGEAIVAVRRGPADGWTIVRHVEDEVEVEVVLPDPGTARITVTSLGGEPLSGVELHLVPMLDGGLAFAHAPYQEPESEITEEEPGVYRLEGLPHGFYSVFGRLEGFGIHGCKLDVGAEPVEVALALPPARSVVVRVLDGATDEPVALAEVETFLPRAVGPAYARAVTDRDGACRLQGIPTGEVLPCEPWVLVRHPAFCDHAVVLEPGRSDVECRLSQGGALSGTLHVGGHPPPGPLALWIEAREPRRGDPLEPRIQALSDGKGRVRVTGLAPGKYSCKVDEPFAGRHPLWSLTPQMRQHSRALAHASFEIREGETTELELELPAAAGDRFGELDSDGRLTLTGWLAVDAESGAVYIDGEYDPLNELSRLPTRMDREVVTERGIRRRETVFFGPPRASEGADQVRELTVLVHLGSSGAPAETWIALEGLDEPSFHELIVCRTDSAGLARVTVEGSGRYRVTSYRPEGGPLEGELTVEADRWPQRVVAEVY